MPTNRPMSVPQRADADAQDGFSNDSPSNSREVMAKDGAPAKKPRETPHPSTEKVSGAGPAMAEHSKDAKAPKGGRSPGAYKKD
ncbi:hypothetical protein [Arvimicrobium flavum]|uniref:hypothetical protein n=1 Tax=Arvimicrobium flavum TaxID=3393320 RepID=UPI00237A5606|nr:hypothetical protein [Mesorhizobium shangrilense]